MKLLPVTLTLFDKATNSTYKGTLLLKNLDGLENDLNATTAEPGSDYDGKGAGLFIILVVSVYALSIVLFIASFITKKATTGETSDDNMVNTYLHKVGDLKEKTARDTFKKLKMSIISKVEMDSENQKRNKKAELDSENQKRGRKGSKGAKDMQSMSRTSSKTSLSGPSKAIAHRASTEAIHSTGLLPKEDEATQPLLAAASDLPTPHPQEDRLAPTVDGLTQGSVSPSLRRATSARMLSVIREVQESGEMSPQVGRTVSYHDVSNSSHRQGTGRLFPHSKSLDSDTTLVKQPISSEHVDGDEEPRTDPPVRAEFGSRSSLFKPVQKQSTEHVNIDVPSGSDFSDAPKGDTEDPQPVPTDSRPVNHPSMERPRPRYSSRPVELDEDVWQHQRPHQPLLPPPAQKTSRKPVHLRVRIPPQGAGSDIWVLRNGRGEPHTEPHVPEARPYSPHTEGHTRGSRRTRSPGRRHEHTVSEALRAQRESDRGRTKRDKSPRDKSPRDKSPRDKSPRDKSPRDKSQRDWSPRDWSRDRSPRRVLDPEDSFYPHDARSLPLPFRTPSPRSPPRSPSDRMPPATRVSPSSFRRSPDVASIGGSNWRDKATLKVTLDRSPEPPEDEGADPYGCANRGYEQSPRLAGMRQAELLTERARTPPRVSFTDSRLQVPGQVPNPRFPVTFNSPGLPRKSPEKGGVQISKV